MNDETTITCPVCEIRQFIGDAVLGTLGRLTHYRCRCCGMQWTERDGDQVQEEDAA